MDPKEIPEFFDFSITQFDSVFFVRLIIDLISMVVLLRLVYYRVTGRHDFFLTFFMFNLVIFIITILLNSSSGFSIGAAFGLFAIFAMLRYRTEDISTRDMTYLFLSITIGLISSINQGTALEIVLINAVILLVAFLIEGNVLIKQEFIKTIEYEKIDLIKPDRREELIADLKDRTGLDIHKVYIKRIDFLRDTAIIKMHYRSSRSQDA
ncbi:MAG: DUF4956 domain-containing protein [Flavobacteriales bacterium]|nr:DUF4956 domain-containing protein [Flavobacteriales bacterium]